MMQVMKEDCKKIIYTGNMSEFRILEKLFQRSCLVNGKFDTYARNDLCNLLQDHLSTTSNGVKSCFDGDFMGIFRQNIGTLGPYEAFKLCILSMVHKRSLEMRGFCMYKRPCTFSTEATDYIKSRVYGKYGSSVKIEY